MTEMLKHTCTECHACPYGGPKVNAYGPIDSPVVVVAENPSSWELREMRPLMGPAGDLLRQAWPEELFPYDQALFVNAVQCITPKTKASNPAKMAKAVRQCNSRLEQLIDLHPRKVVITLGSWASISIIKQADFKITKERGRVKDMVIRNQTIPVGSTVHPAFLLRGSGSLPTFKDDLRKFLYAGGYQPDTYIPDPLTTYREPDIQEVLTFSDLDEMFHHFQQIQRKDQEFGSFVAADIETASLNPWDDIAEVLCVGLCSASPLNLMKERPLAWVVSPALLDHPELRQWLSQALGFRWIWHNGHFDKKYLRVVQNLEVEVHEDTLLMSYALDETSGGHDLETLARNYTGAPLYKHDVKRWLRKRSDSYKLLPWEVLVDRNGKDIYNTAILWHALRPKVQEGNLESLYRDVLVPTTKLLVDVETRGIYVDDERIEANRTRLTEEAEVAAEKFYQITGERINLNSPMQVADVLYGKLGIKYKNRRPQSTDAKILDKLKEEPAVKALLEYRKVTKALSTYVTPLAKHRQNDGRVHTSFKQHRTSTGRLSSSEPNIQNIPRNKDIRGMYRAAPGNSLLEADFNAAELRMLAILSRDEFLTGIYLDGERSLHDEVAVAMYGPNFNGDQRIRAKAINFGIPYGREAFSIAEEFNISVQEAQRLIDAWFANAPGAHKFLKWCRESPGLGRTLRTVFGRKRRPGVVSYERLKGLQNEFANFFMQSTVNDICLKAARVLNNGPLEAMGAQIVNLVHDSIVVEAFTQDPVKLGQIARMMTQVMENVQNGILYTPIRMTVEVKSGTYWGALKLIELGPELTVQELEELGVKDIRWERTEEFLTRAEAEGEHPDSVLVYS